MSEFQDMATLLKEVKKLAEERQELATLLSDAEGELQTVAIEVKTLKNQRDEWRQRYARATPQRGELAGLRQELTRCREKLERINKTAVVSREDLRSAIDCVQAARDECGTSKEGDRWYEDLASRLEQALQPRG